MQIQLRKMRNAECKEWFKDMKALREMDDNYQEEESGQRHKDEQSVKCQGGEGSSQKACPPPHHIS